MTRYRQIWKQIIQKAAEAEAGTPIDADAVIVEKPPRAELGDLAFPMFPFARILKRSPVEIAALIAGRICGKGTTATAEQADWPRGVAAARAEAQGPYVNVHLDRPSVTAEVSAEIFDSLERYEGGENLAGQRIVIEFSAPNTNKPLHLGHLRNDALGMSIARILACLGADVYKVNLINDRGVHICKSMLAYQRFGDGTYPEHLGQKGDHLVGDFYVRFA